MNLSKTILCDWLGWHDYEKNPMQDETGYVRRDCTRCNDTAFDPR